MTLILQHADSAATICPDIGGTIARFTWRGHRVLRHAGDASIEQHSVRDMGCYPLVPYSNRIGLAQLPVGGEIHQLRANSPPERHALHGFGWQRPWQVAAQTADSVELQLAHAADADWPFACETRQAIRVTGNALLMSIALRNADTRPMPAGLGFHPYFPIGHNTRLKADWKNMWKMGADKLPTELAPVPAEADYRHARVVDGWQVDNCFTGWNRLAVLDYPTHRVLIEASAACRQIVCYAPNDGRHFIALEPVSHVNNAFALAAAGVTGTGMKLLAPGESFSISMSILAAER